jgi:hypothetical protein
MRYNKYGSKKYDATLSNWIKQTKSPMAMSEYRAPQKRVIQILGAKEQIVPKCIRSPK